MPEDDDLPNGSAGRPAEPGKEEHSLLRSPPDFPRSSPSSSTESLSLPRKQWRPSHPKRQSSLSHPRPDGTPRTTNRVRFDIDETANGHVAEEEWMDDEDYLHSPRQDVPLLTDITPPSSSPFLSDAFQPEDHLPNARPKSSTRSAIMNMANSIIGAGKTYASTGRSTLISSLPGIIGQPYAFRQAGLTMGIILLIGLTVTVDWTIRLIIINCKLSGTHSYQGTMQLCFGKSGLVAISVAQWAFAFGGMIAFCIIVGDSIPHVIEALFPGLKDMRFLWLLTDRRAVIVLFTLGVSFPLSLYRDIAKVSANLEERFRTDGEARESINVGIAIHVDNHHNGTHARPESRHGSTRRSEGHAFRQLWLLSSRWGHLVRYAVSRISESS